MSAVVILAFIVCGLTCVAMGALAITVCEGRRWTAAALAVVVAVGIWLTFFIVDTIPHN